MSEEVTTTTARDEKIPSETSPVLEHLVTPSYARTVEQGVTDEEFEALFSGSTEQEEELVTSEQYSQPTQDEMMFIPDDHEEVIPDSREMTLEVSEAPETIERTPIQHIDIPKETREYSFAMSETVLESLGNDSEITPTSLLPAQAKQPLEKEPPREESPVEEEPPREESPVEDEPPREESPVEEELQR